MAAKGTNNIASYNQTLTAQQRKESARRAAKASAEARKQKRLWKESVENLMAGTLTADDAGRIREKFGLDAETDLTQQDKVVAAIAERAQRGDKDCAQFLRDTVGQNPQVMVKVGNLDDKPFEMLDLASLSDQELRRLAERELQKQE